MADGGPPHMVRRLAVEVVDARDLVPMDGLGTSSAYAVANFDGQRKRTRTVPRDLDPQWHERLEFAVPDPASMHAESLDVSLYHNRRFNPSGGGGKNNFLGHVRIYGSQFSRHGEEGIVYFPLEKRNLLSWIRGEVGLKIYYYDAPAVPPPPEDRSPEGADNAPPPEVPPEPPKELPEVPEPTEAAVEVQQPQAQPPVIIVEEAPMHGPHGSMMPPMHNHMMQPMHGPHGPMLHGPHGPMMHARMMPPQPEPEPETEHEPGPGLDGAETYPPEVRKARMASSTGRVCVPRHPSARVISGRFVSTGEAVEPVQSTYDLVESMRYLFVRIVRVRGIRACEGPYVKIQASPHCIRSRPDRDVSGSPEWYQVFAVGHAKPEPKIGISVWDGGAPSPADAFLGGVCFDLSDVPVRDQPDGPLVAHWYQLEGGEPGMVTGDIMVSMWICTQAADVFPEAWNRYLRASVIEAQDLRVPSQHRKSWEMAQKILGPTAGTKMLSLLSFFARKMLSLLSSTAPTTTAVSSSMDNVNPEPTVMPLDLLREIADGFSEERKLGSGSYGKVYLGVHQDGEKIAVKMLYDMPGLDDEQFQNEFKNLSRLQHQNIVRLVGYCHDIQEVQVQHEGKLVLAEKTHRALCFEYMSNGSLEKYLSDECDKYDWHTGYGIIKGVCQGLKYLHNELKPPIYHFDLKPANVLLDENMVPRIADFGMSRLFGDEQTRATKSFLGTIGYLPPEYINNNLISSKFDIFSLGVVIIKIMAGRAGYYNAAEMSSQEFTNLVQENWMKRLNETSNMMKAYSEQVKTCIEIGLSCVQEDRHKRPTIQDIVDRLDETETECTYAARKNWSLIYQM